MYRKSAESTTNPTALLQNKAIIFPLSRNGVYIAKSMNSENKNAMPLAIAILSPPSSRKDRMAPTKIAAATQYLLDDSCRPSLIEKANPAKYTPAGALNPNPIGTMPHLFIDQLAKKITAM